MEDIQEQLKQEAIQLGLCDKWQSEWGTPNVDDLCDKYIRGIDFCIKHKWPTPSFIRDNFNQDDVERNGIYTEKERVSRWQKRVVAIGDSVVDIYVDDHSVCDIYVLDNAEIRLHLGKFSFSYVSIHDNAHVKIIDKEMCAKVNTSVFADASSLINPDKFDVIHYKNVK